ncbi:MAG: hypothetical protein PHT07_10155 [Paludibacter sp.]|nr:hypothetical protein [Paludibacter sp.]
MQKLEEKVIETGLFDKKSRAIGLMVRTFIVENDGRKYYEAQILALRDGEHFGPSTKAEVAENIAELEKKIDTRVKSYLNRVNKARHINS